MKIPELQNILLADLCTHRQTKLLKKLNLLTCEDLILHFPFRYEDRSKIYTISEALSMNNACVVEATVTAHESFFWNNKQQTKILIKDSTASAELVAFNSHYIKNQLLKGSTVLIYGVFDLRFNRIQSSHFEYELKNKMPPERSLFGKIIPIYRLTDSLKTKEFITIVRKMFSLYYEMIHDPIPKYFIEGRTLIQKAQCLKELHFPSTINAINKAKTRGAYEEFLCARLSLERQKQNERKNTKKHTYTIESTMHNLLKILPFDLTSAQKKAMQEIEADLNSPYAMNRLVQGDVGCGKTIVALFALIHAALSRLQAVFLAPTEVLAFQHFKKIKIYTDQLKINCVILTGSIKGKQRKEIMEHITNGTAEIIIGTHALFQEQVSYKNLSLVIIDEQHKFGVEQRSNMIKKGYCPDILAMTATPIPRTITLTLYGDMDISIINELPKGRQSIISQRFDTLQSSEIIEHIRKELSLERQIFIVCPLIDIKNNGNNIRAVEDVYEEIRTVFPKNNIGCIHGRMSQDEKDLLMQNFLEKTIHIMIATTVIEVGIDIPNASTMIIENAEQFGLAQLHQLRGRVGRGTHQSYCFLISQNQTANQRLDVLINTQNGFDIAEADLLFRGPGELLGTRQTGLPDFHIAHFLKDQAILDTAIKDAQLILSKDPDLSLSIHSKLAQFITKSELTKMLSG